MLDPIKMQRLSGLVQGSSILNAQEKAEWLSLMGLMDDKQLAELEEILQSSAPAAPTPKPSPIMEAPTPTLSHISNLPSRMVDPRLAQKPKSQLSPGPDRDFAAKSRLRPMSTPKPKPRPPMKAPEPATIPLNMAALSPVDNEPNISGPSISSPILSAEAAARGLKLMAISDVSKLTAEALHHQNRENFFAAISALAEKEGYFQVLSHFEESPLYQDYLNYGKLILGGVSGDHLPLTQEEFEFVADLLQALKINRV